MSSCQLLEGEVVFFPDGFIGFPEWNRFVLLPGPAGSDVMRLKCLTDPDVCFVVTDPRHVYPGYGVSVPKEEIVALGLESLDEGLLLCTITIRGEPPVVTINLLAPLLINPGLNIGKQLVLAESGYSPRHVLAVLEQEPGNEKRKAG